MFRRLSQPTKNRYPRFRITRMSSIVQMTAQEGVAEAARSISSFVGVAIEDLPKSNVFTQSLPSDPQFPTPTESHKASRRELGPRRVRGALYTYVRPEKRKNTELLAVSHRAMRDLGLKEGEDQTREFKELMAGNRIEWNEETGTGIYPWAQCYGGWQFGVWAGQLGDGRAISLFETTNPATKARFELQLKGTGRTPYSRFADGKAVLRSSLREFIVSEALNGLRIPTTRAVALTLTNDSVIRERIEPGAIVARFAQSWLRIGTFDILGFQGNRNLIRTLATYVAENVFPGWVSLPAHHAPDKPMLSEPPRGVDPFEIQGPIDIAENRFTRLYREIVRRNASTVAHWQAYAFTNGVLNTDNTSILGLSLDFGPFAFLDNFDPSFTPNHEDHELRYSYINQPQIIWWNLTRLGESLGELMGAGAHVDDESFKTSLVTPEFAPEVVSRAEKIIYRVAEEYEAVYKKNYNQLMRARLGLLSDSELDHKDLIAPLLASLEALELDYNHFFFRLSSINLGDLDTDIQRNQIASVFFHAEGVSAVGVSELEARARIASWLLVWRSRVAPDWASKGETGDAARRAAMKAVNPRFIPRSWILDEIIQRVDKGKERKVLERVMKMAENPFAEGWGGDYDEEERWCGDVPRSRRMMTCSCSS